MLLTVLLKYVLLTDIVLVCVIPNRGLLNGVLVNSAMSVLLCYIVLLNVTLFNCAFLNGTSCYRIFVNDVLLKQSLVK